jgi:hypothetical protein
MSALGDAALAYAERGWYVFPLKARGKEPIYPGGFKTATADPKRVRALWRKHPNANIGVHPGPSGLLVIDLDGPTGEATAKEIGLLDIETLTARTGRGRHLYFLHPGGTVSNRGIGEGIDVRGNNGYVAAPPSVHPNGSVYEWIDPSCPVQPLPECVRVLLNRGTPGKSRQATRGELNSGAILEGARNNYLTSHAGKLFARGMSEEEVLALVLDRNKRKCKPPLSDKEVEDIVFNIAKAEQEQRETRDGRIAELNAVCALVLIGDKAAILVDGSGHGFVDPPGQGFRLLGLSAFRDWLKPHTVWVGKQPVPLAEYWLQHPQRRHYDKLVFAPEQVVEGAYNLWRGFAVEPNPSADCCLFLTHIRDNVCQGNEHHYRWIIAFFAQIVQQPTEKPGVAIVLRGRQGVGKTIVGKTFGKLFGEHYALVSDPRYVTGRFNSHLAQLLVLQLDEAVWAGDHVAEGKLKDLITGEYQFIEFKGKEPFRIRNYVRILVTSNATWSVPAGLEERRFAVFDVGEGRIQDHTYFAAIEDQLEHGGYGALLYFLQRFDLGSVDLRKIPKTEALLEQKQASFSPLQAWWMDVLQSGRLPGDKGGEGRSPAPILYDHFIGHAQKVGLSRRATETMLGQFLRRYVPGVRKTGGGTYTSFVTGECRPCALYVFPSLAECRESFGKALQQRIEWDGPDEWVGEKF